LDIGQALVDSSQATFNKYLALFDVILNAVYGILLKK